MSLNLPLVASHRDTDNGPIGYLHDSNGDEVAVLFLDASPELAAEIACRVNLHDELVEALKIAHPYISNDAARKIVGDLIVKAEER